MKLLITALSLTISISSFAQQTVEGVTMPATITAKGKTLQLNGAGLREKLWLDLYVGGLYVTTKSADANKVINADEPMAIKMEIVSSLISSEKMIGAIEEGMEKSTKGNTAQFSKEIEQLKAAFAEEIVDGNTYEIIYIPGEGIVVTKGSKEVTSIACGIEFKKAVFGIWLCDDPADEDLKEGMLKG
ncbi:MAG: chalcone isomerase family protein [Flavobacteriales bacterium]|nr:chalcone isomerase family protein [Flavobacteriales bacterium]